MHGTYDQPNNMLDIFIDVYHLDQNESPNLALNGLSFFCQKIQEALTNLFTIVKVTLVSSIGVSSYMFSLLNVSVSCSD